MTSFTVGKVLAYRRTPRDKSGRTVLISHLSILHHKMELAPSRVLFQTAFVRTRCEVAAVNVALETIYGEYKTPWYRRVLLPLSHFSSLWSLIPFPFKHSNLALCVFSLSRDAPSSGFFSVIFSLPFLNSSDCDTTVKRGKV